MSLRLRVSVCRQCLCVCMCATTNHHSPPSTTTAAATSNTGHVLLTDFDLSYARGTTTPKMQARRGGSSSRARGSSGCTKAEVRACNHVSQRVSASGDGITHTHPVRPHPSLSPPCCHSHAHALHRRPAQCPTRRPTATSCYCSRSPLRAPTALWAQRSTLRQRCVCVFPCQPCCAVLKLTVTRSSMQGDPGSGLWPQALTSVPPPPRCCCCCCRHAVRSSTLRATLRRSTGGALACCCTS